MKVVYGFGIPRNYPAFVLIHLLFVMVLSLVLLSGNFASVPTIIKILPCFISSVSLKGAETKADQ